MKPIGITLVVAGTIALFITFPVLLIPSALGWGMAFFIASR